MFDAQQVVAYEKFVALHELFWLLLVNPNESTV
jgi:hypothetical protein